MADLRKLARIQIVMLVLFVLNKFALRPYILRNEIPDFFQYFVLSFPNFCEAVIGTITIVYIGLILNNRLFEAAARIKDVHIYLGATVLAGIYVILQELKIHNLGGRNTYDPVDVLFSLLGLIAVYLLLLYLKPRIID